MEKLFGERLVLVNEAAMKLITDDTHLPVMARNCLETGNENLWYEQVLPRFTRLYTIFFSDTKKEKSSMKAFFDELNQGVFQIGANASIGYGFCKFDDIETLLNSASHENKK
ncbi:MAG: hypothetical protein LUD02_02810 [Tannerellaceae bacterium]|nr:hypothetical protein [Tannerellaceae bacterium]MCD8263203.1 hypothetical protein [Tannerellaceae bacterium]